MKKMKTLFITSEGERKKIDIELSKESQEELNKITQDVEIMLKPLYDGLGVDIKTEELHWTNGEVFIINKKTRERREIQNNTQKKLNKKLFQHAIDNAKAHKKR